MILWLQARCLLHCFTGWRAQSRSRPDRPRAHGKSATKLDRLVLWLASIAPRCDRRTCNDRCVRSLATSFFAYLVVFEAPGSNLRAPFLSLSLQSTAMDAAAEFRYIATCAAWVGAIRGDVEAAVTMLRFIELRLQGVPPAFAPRALTSLRHDLRLVIRDLDALLAYVLELEHQVERMVDAWLRTRAHLFEEQ